MNEISPEHAAGSKAERRPAEREELRVRRARFAAPHPSIAPLLATLASLAITSCEAAPDGPATGGSDAVTGGTSSGSCEAGCPTGSTCLDSTCVCVTPGEELCQAGCVQPLTDDANCGGCSNACPIGSYCDAGDCHCPGSPSSIVCSSECVDLATSQSHCGACDVQCPPGVACASGACQCPQETSFCGSQCVDLASANSHCGACNNGCSAGSCIGGHCIALLGETPRSASNLALSADTVYWTDGEGHGLHSVPKLGGPTNHIVSGTVDINAVAAFEDHVYYSPYGEIRRIHKDGGAPITLSAGIGAYVTSIAVKGADLYWATSNQLRRQPLAGGPVTTLSTQCGGHLSATEYRMYWACGDKIQYVTLGETSVQTRSQFTFLSGIAVDDNSIFVTAHTSLFRASQGGNDLPVSIGTGPEPPPTDERATVVAINSSDAFWIVGDGKIARIPKQANAPTPPQLIDLQLDPGTLPISIAVDEEALYVATGRQVVPLGGQILRVSL